MHDSVFAGGWRQMLFRLAIAAAALVIWFWTQSLLGERPAPSGVIGDRVHDLTAGCNAYLAASPYMTDGLLIVSSALIDVLAIFLIGSWILAGRVRPFLGLFLLMVLRQVMQALCVLPVPPHMIWHYPGFPSLLVTYSVSSDFFFSGHTAIAVYGAVELAKLRRGWLTIAAVLIVLLEVATVLILRAHYTMDVFTGAVAALWVAQIAEPIAQKLERRLSS